MEARPVFPTHFLCEEWEQLADRFAEDELAECQPWDPEQLLAFQSGSVDLSGPQVIELYANDQKMEEAKEQAVEDAHRHARRLAVVVHNFISDEECDSFVERAEAEALLQPTESDTLARLLAHRADFCTRKS